VDESLRDPPSRLGETRLRDVPQKLRALWALYCTGGLNEEFLARQLDHDSEHIRAWAVRLLCDEKPPSAHTIDKFAAMARKDRSPLVRLYLAAMLQRIPLERRWELAAALAEREENAKDQNLPLMIWYGIEPLVASDVKRGAKLLTQCKIPQVRQFIARRLAVE